MKEDLGYKNQKKSVVTRLLQKFVNQVDKLSPHKHKIPYKPPIVKEDTSTNSMGSSSSTSGPIQTYDPILPKKVLRRKKLRDVVKKT